MRKFVFYLYALLIKYVYHIHLLNIESSYLLMFCNKQGINKIMYLLNNIHNLYLNTISDIAGTDFLEKNDRFYIFYNLLSLTYNYRILVCTRISELSFLDSINNIFPASVWYEREIWDLYGVYFNNNNDLRRILTDYGFIGHPMRKDFPLSGYIEVYYNYRISSVVSKNITLSQEFRFFNTQTEWEYFQLK